MNRLLFTLPFIAFTAMIIILFYSLSNNDQQSSSLMGEPVPEFTLRQVDEDIPNFSHLDLSGQVVLVHFFASWCPSCQREHHLLMKLTQDHKIPIYGIGVKEHPLKLLPWLQKNGNPFTKLGLDELGQVRVEWQVRTIPETFIISKEGEIVYRHHGSLSAKTIESVIMPKINQLRE